jgi:hypothetical protein
VGSFPAGNVVERLKTPYHKKIKVLQHVSQGFGVEHSGST